MHMSKSELKCRKCGSNEIKKTFLGGSGKIWGAIFIFFGASNVLFGRHLSEYLSGATLLLIGLVSLFFPKYKCNSCGKKF